MPLRRLLGLSAIVSGGLRRCLTTAASRPAWAMICQPTMAVGSAGPGAYVRLAEPPRVSELHVPEHLVDCSARPDPDSDVAQLLRGQICSASGDGLLLLTYFDIRATAPIIAKQGAREVRDMTGIAPDHVPDTTRFVCNPLTCQLSRLPAIVCNPLPRKVLYGKQLGILTEADRGRGPPDRFAIAELKGKLMLRFLSDTGEWEIVPCSPCQLPLARSLEIDQHPLAFGGRLWWVDVTWGVISADPFSDWPEQRFIELPRGSVLPAGARKEAFCRGISVPDAESNLWWMQAPVRYRRVGVSEGRLRYAEVTREEPFVLSSFVLDDEEGGGWTLEHRVALSRLWADGGHPWLPLQAGTTPRIGVLDPFSANVMYLSVGRHVVAVDLLKGEVIGSSPCNGDCCIPCVLPPWLGSSRIPSAGKKDLKQNKTLADVLVRSVRH